MTREELYDELAILEAELCIACGEAMKEELKQEILNCKKQIAQHCELCE